MTSIDTAQVAPVGQTIIRLGQAWRAGRITLAAAVDQLITAHPEAGFVARGAEAQLRTWDGAHLRYRIHPTPPPRPACERAGAWRGQPIHLHLPAARP